MRIAVLEDVDGLPTLNTLRQAIKKGPKFHDGIEVIGGGIHALGDISESGRAQLGGDDRGNDTRVHRAAVLGKKRVSLWISPALRRLWWPQPSDA